MNVKAFLAPQGRDQFRPSLVGEVQEQRARLQVKQQTLLLRRCNSTYFCRAVQWRQGYPGPFLLMVQLEGLLCREKRI